MAPIVALFVLVFLVLLPFYRRLSASGGLTLVSIASLLAVTVLSPASGIWLLGSILLVHVAMGLGDKSNRRGAVSATASLLLAAGLLFLREVPGLFWIGVSYFTLRHIHILMEWWMGRLERPSLSQLCTYNLFLPVLVAGPIHRFHHFHTAVANRDLSAPAFWTGAERVLLGSFSAVVLGGWLTHRLHLETQNTFLPGFLDEWLASCVYWIGLYFTFSGLTSIALGLSLMAGLRLEENFNKPWRARNLIEFWGRWHITLSGWCRDYVFQTFTAYTRLPSVGLVLSMLAMGLWHGATLYWVLWGIWQGGGLVLTRLFLRMPMSLPGFLTGIVGRLSIVLWLTFARPVIVTLFGASP